MPPDPSAAPARPPAAGRPEVPAAAAIDAGAARPAPAIATTRRRVSVLRSASLRLAVGYAALFGLSAVVFMTFLWVASVNMLERQVEGAIRADADELSTQWQGGGLGSLMLTIQARLDQDVDDSAIYLLDDQEGTRLAGNLEHWPTQITRTDIWYELPISRAGRREIAEMRAFQLPGGDRLLVGRDIRGRNLIRALLARTLLTALLAVCVLSGLGALVVRNLFNRMVSNVAGTASRIGAGDLGERVKLSGSGDEFDQVAATINDMLDRIARLMDGVRQVSNAIAHDLRTPITRARSLLEDAVAGERTPDELRDAITTAVENLDGITKVFEALLRISEIEAGARRSAFATFDVAPMLLTLVDFYSALAEEKETTLTADVPNRLMLHGDRALLQQAVANLLDNAIKFSPAGGTIRLQAAADEQTTIIRIVDGGPGMPPADLARATERFFRGERARSTPGSGLGLALVQAVVQLHGGALTLEAASPGLSATIAIPAVWRRA